MQPQRKPNHEAQQRIDPAWELVRRVPGLCKSAADKLAWLYCWNKSLRGRQRITVHAGEIAADQGVTSDAGRQRITNLVESGLLILVGSDRFTGVHTVELADPGRVMQARAIPWDGQLDLPFAAEGDNGSQASIGDARHDAAASLRACDHRRTSDEEPPEVPPEEPRPTHLTFEGLAKAKPLPSPLASLNQGQDSQRASGSGSSSGGSSEDADLIAEIARRQAEAAQAKTAKPIENGLAESLANLAAPPDPAMRTKRIEQLQAYIVARVACEKLTGNRPLKLAELIVDGLMPERELISLLNYLDRQRKAGNLQQPPSCYFNVGARRLIGRYGSFN
jgi:hypothetical protein